MANDCECGHPRIRHVQDGTGWTCVVCAFEIKEGINPNRKTVCTRKQNFKLSQYERDQAMAASKESYPQHIVCAICFFEWMNHAGYLCPTGDDTFLPLLDA